MWPFRRRRERKIKRAWEKVVVGLVIGGAIGSIVGKTLLEDREKDEDQESPD